jgi:DNA modification methylase
MTLHHGDCLAILPTLEAESIDAIVTDPPYGLEFMGKGWDRLTDIPDRDQGPRGRNAYGGWHGSPGSDPRKMQDWHEAWAREAFRVAKPGAHLLAFGGTRTYHRLASAIEDAGWEIRDTLVWAYASGFPKSLDVSKAIDKAAGAEREKVASGAPVKRMIPGADQNRTGDWTKNNGREYQPGVELPATDAAREWQGWGTALKPAWEPIVMARKPLRGTVAGNVQAYGTGALNIDGCRIGTEGGGTNCTNRDHAGRCQGHGNAERSTENATVHGPESSGARWPANVILTDPIFDGDTPGVVGGGETTSGAMGPVRRSTAPLFSVGHDLTYETPGDSGTYSRFFLIPKAPRRDREPGNPDGISPLRVNTHPTVKPSRLMRHLVRLVTPPGGVVLDPFLGSGTTALACQAEGFDWVGIEREAEYVAIAEARLNGTQKGLSL